MTCISHTAQPFLHVTHRPEIHPPPRQAPAMTSRSAGHPRPVHRAARRPSPPHASVSTRGWCRQMGHRSSLPLPAQPARHAPAGTHNAPNQATPSTSIARPDEEHACRQRLLLPETHIRGQERRGEGADSTTLPHAPAPSPRRSPPPKSGLLLHIAAPHAEVAENPRKARGTRELCVARTCRQPVHPVVAGGGRVLTSPQHVLPPILLQRGSTLPRGRCELTPPRAPPLPRAVRLRHRPLMPGTCGRSQPRTPHRWRGRGNGVGGKPSVARRGAAGGAAAMHASCL